MTLFDLKKIFVNLFSFYKKTGKKRKYNKLKKEVNKIYKELKIDMVKDLNTVLDIEVKKTSKQLQADIELNFIQKRRIIKKNDLIKRLERKSKKLIKDIKKNINNSTAIKKRFGTEYNNIKRIYNTEGHRVKEASKSKVNDIANRIGIKTRKKWIARMINTREKHIILNNTYADKDGYFYVNGNKTKYPGGFGVASLDINCKCKVIIERVKTNG